MSRDETATVYLDNLLGFHRNFHTYHEAAETLTGDDKSILEQAVSGNRNCDGTKKGGVFFGY
jgi:hypothetical protein